MWSLHHGRSLVWSGRAWWWWSGSLSKAVLTVPNHLPVLHVPSHSFQEELCYGFPRHRCEVGRSVVPGVLLFFFTLFKDGHNVSLREVLRDCTWLRDFSSTMDQWRNIHGIIWHAEGCCSFSHMTLFLMAHILIFYWARQSREAPMSPLGRR